jgi:voltage-gated potassium channel Kch
MFGGYLSLFLATCRGIAAFQLPDRLERARTVRIVRQGRRGVVAVLGAASRTHTKQDAVHGESRAPIVRSERRALEGGVTWPCCDGYHVL